MCEHFRILQFICTYLYFLHLLFSIIQGGVRLTVVQKNHCLMVTSLSHLMENLHTPLQTFLNDNTSSFHKAVFTLFEAPVGGPVKMTETMMEPVEPH